MGPELYSSCKMYLVDEQGADDADTEREIKLRLDLPDLADDSAEDRAAKEVLRKIFAGLA